MPNKDQRFADIVNQLRNLIEQAIVEESERLHALGEVAIGLRPQDVSELIIGARRFRNKHLVASLFGEPAWDILLHLHIAHYRGQSISVSAAVTFGGSAPTTGLRWLRTLEHNGLVERHEDPDDHRRSFVALTTHGVDKLDEYIADYSSWIATKATLRQL